MASACGIDYDAAVKDAEQLTIGGVDMPVASPRTLIRTKQTVHRELDLWFRQLDALRSVAGHVLFAICGEYVHNRVIVRR